jgi:Asp-tRNA(Asn)/Glu-tRNA(Gln) amidotransferase A subunit family amidase
VPDLPQPLPDRRRFLAYFSSIGLGSTLLPGVLWAKVSAGAEITTATIASAEEIAGLKFTEAERAQMATRLKQQEERQVEGLHKIALDNSVVPAIVFNPIPPGMPRPVKTPRQPAIRSRVATRQAPADLDALAFLPVTELSELVRRRQVTPTQLTQMYLARLRRYDPVLKCVITLTEERALKQAAEADAEIARGHYRGPLHGIPWGAKDLLAVRGYPTTWGAGPYRDQVIDTDATVVRRLDDAGAILVAKLSLGELAQGDVWFGHGPTDATPEEKTRTGQRTRNPWQPAQGSSGSSAGPASATAAGLVGFAIGSETLGSISSPSTRCGTTGLRPTFGRVPRTGAMALSWTMDKLGPLCRSAEDCALVLDAIYGSDGSDPAAIDAPYRWDASIPLKSIRVGYIKSAFDYPVTDPKDPKQTLHPFKAQDDAALAALRSLGIDLIPVEIPDLDYGAMRLVLTAEGAAAFDELTRSGRDKDLVQQGDFDWPNTFRVARFITAVDYVNANRARTIAIQRWADLMKTVDVIVSPTSVAGPSQLTATNLTGHPAVILPHGFVDFDAAKGDHTQVPVSLTFLGGLFQEGKLLAVANAFQRATKWQERHPELKV